MINLVKIVGITINVYVSFSIIGCKEVGNNPEGKIGGVENTNRYEGTWTSDQSLEFDGVDSLNNPIHLVTPKKLKLIRESDTQYLIDWGEAATIGLEDNRILSGHLFTLIEKEGKLHLYVGKFGAAKPTDFYWVRSPE
jgi:hypothetical protein